MVRPVIEYCINCILAIIDVLWKGYNYDSQLYLQNGEGAVHIFGIIFFLFMYELERLQDVILQIFVHHR